MLIVACLPRVARAGSPARRRFTRARPPSSPLGGSHLFQGRGVDHVGDRAIALLGVVAHDRLPPLRTYAELLGEQRDEDLGLLLAEPGERRHPLEQVLRVGRLGPEALGVRPQGWESVVGDYAQEG